MKLIKLFFLFCYIGSPLLLSVVENTILYFFIIALILFLFSCFLMFMKRYGNIKKDRDKYPTKIGSMIICVILITTIIIFSSKSKIYSLESAGVYLYVAAGAVYIFGVTNLSPLRKPKKSIHKRFHF